MDARRPTPRQLDALCAIADLIRENGGCPSCAELGKRLGITRQAASLLIDSLREKRLVNDKPGEWRSYTPTDEGDRVLASLTTT